MVHTWDSAWFGETGTRLIYLLPESENERLLPLKIEPAPKELKRVMVGRLDYLSPEREQEIEKLLRKHKDQDETTIEKLAWLGHFRYAVCASIRQRIK